MTQTLSLKYCGIRKAPIDSFQFSKVFQLATVPKKNYLIVKVHITSLRLFDEEHWSWKSCACVF